MTVTLFSSHHNKAEIKIHCSEHNLFGSLPVTEINGRFSYSLQVGDRKHGWKSNKDFAYFKTLLSNIY